MVRVWEVVMELGMYYLYSCVHSVRNIVVVPVTW